MPTVYGSLLSPYVRKVLITLKLKGIKYDFQELHPLVEAHKEKLCQLNPLGKIPIYQEHDFIIPDSSVICAYLDKEYPQYSIIPSQPKENAKSLWYEEYSDTRLTPTIVTIFVNKITVQKLNLPPDDKALQNSLEVKLPEVFHYLDREITHKKYFVGDKFSIADISISSAFISFKLLGLIIDENKWNNLAQYVDSIFKEQAINQVFRETKIKFQEKYE